ncbi:MAG: ATP-binding protein [Bryobacterales bacterium]|nr:ATP-binding protein [Bryobacteraceae bacterium]MDW8129964.1 ATP-binding protein [Bryobacterales bacterium]
MAEIPLAARLFAKFMAALLCLFGGAVVAVDMLASRVAVDSYVDTLAERLESEAHSLARTEALAGGRLAQQQLVHLAGALGARITLVAPDGRVLADSEADPAQMENHRTRPEVASALNGRPGRSVRKSPTVGSSFLYVAVPSPHGAVRLAAPLERIEARSQAVRGRVLAAIALAFLPFVALSAWLARRIATRMAAVMEMGAELARGNFTVRLPEAGGGELRAFIRHLNQTGEKLQKLVEDLEREHAELERLERVRRDFVVNVSHELRTPVASIQGYAETLLDGALEDPRHNRRFLQVIRQNAERLGRLTQDLLALTQLEWKTRRFEFASYRLAALLDEAVETIRPIAAKKNVSVERAEIPEHWEVFCDAAAVHQIMANLLDNAVKFSPEGGMVEVSARLERDAGHVVVCVRDQGPGIPAADLPRIFERFYRVDKARSRELGGTGLGLAIVKHLVQAHGGRIWVESEPGRGAAFFFTLPLEDPGLAAEGDLHREFTVM